MLGTTVGAEVLPTRLPLSASLLTPRIVGRPVSRGTPSHRVSVDPVRSVFIWRDKPHQPINSFRRRRAPERHLRLAIEPRGPVVGQTFDDDADAVHG